MIDKKETRLICNQLYTKSSLKIAVYDNTKKAFDTFKEHSHLFAQTFHKTYPDSPVHVAYENKQAQSFYLQFGSDILFFLLHSNVFEFNRDHEVMKTPYVKENKERSYCGLISIYNFLADSLLYSRYNDLGYLIGRIFVNSENHYYIDGKKEIGQIYNNFATNILNTEASDMILKSAIQYAINFDLLVPPYDAMKEISVYDMTEINNRRIPIQTAKRLGFRFQADNDK